MRFDLKKFSQNIAALREKRGLSQAKAAEIAGMSSRTWQDIERGINTPGIDNAVSIASALGVSIVELLGSGKPNEVHSIDEFLLLKWFRSADKKRAVLVLQVVSALVGAEEELL